MSRVRLITAVSTALLLGACSVSERPPFETMTEEEIFTYNLEKPLLDKIYCFEEQHTSSYIRRRKCMTVYNYVDRNQRALDALYTLQPSTGYSIFRGQD